MMWWESHTHNRAGGVYLACLVLLFLTFICLGFVWDFVGFSVLFVYFTNLSLSLCYGFGLRAAILSFLSLYRKKNQTQKVNYLALEQIIKKSARDTWRGKEAGKEKST